MLVVLMIHSFSYVNILKKPINQNIESLKETKQTEASEGLLCEMTHVKKKATIITKQIIWIFFT
jgi:septation ring formation regulator EzrA